VLNGTINSKPFGGHSSKGVFSNYPVTAGTALVSTAPIPLPGGWEATVAARSNPSRPVVTPATLIQDFVELPKMLRDIPRLINRPKKLLTANELADKNLAVQFGWLPFIRDINQLLNLQTHVDRRSRELHKLYSGKGLRRRLTLDELHRNGIQTFTKPVGSGCSFNYTTDISVTGKMWATVRWKPLDVPYFSPTTAVINQKARRIVLGLTPEGLVSGAWDVIPWTWLIDWFVNVGDFLGSYSNTVPAVRTSTCLMNETTITVSPGSLIPNAGTKDCSVVQTGVWKKTSKYRQPGGSLTPGFNIPFIGVSRLSILSSLAIQRFKG
jgi:hypothetical protein